MIRKMCLTLGAAIIATTSSAGTEHGNEAGMRTT